MGKHVNKSSRQYLKDKEGRFRGSLPVPGSAPQSAPDLPSGLNKAVDDYAQADAASMSFHERNLQVADEIDKALDAIKDYAEAEDKRSLEREREFDARLAELNSNLASIAKKLDDFHISHVKPPSKPTRRRRWFGL